jgi:hypothetical protein
MANAVWPGSLPQRALKNGYMEKPRKIALRTQMDAGTAKTRRRFTAGPAPIDVQFRMSSAQVDTVLGFYGDTLADGALPFDWLHPRTQVLATWRFLEEPSVSPIDGPWFAVSCKLEKLP